MLPAIGEEDTDKELIDPNPRKSRSLDITGWITRFLITVELPAFYHL